MPTGRLMLRASGTRLATILGIPMALLLTPGAALGVSDGGSCPNATSGFARVTLEEWWLNTVEFGFGGDVDLAVETIAELVGIEPTVQAAHDFVIAGVTSLDVNDNGFVCQKRLPATKGHPSYVFNGVDDARSSG
jgi:hypothetical protein